MGTIQWTVLKHVRPRRSKPKGAKMAPKKPGTRRSSGGALPLYLAETARYRLIKLGREYFEGSGLDLLVEVRLGTARDDLAAAYPEECHSCLLERAAGKRNVPDKRDRGTDGKREWTRTSHTARGR
jgi:hypothetical protein